MILAPRKYRELLRKLDVKKYIYLFRNELQVQLKSLSRSEQIPFWIIIVAALSAFLIILIVVLIMWKKKCFEYGPKTTQATTSKAENAPMLYANTEDIQ